VKPTIVQHGDLPQREAAVRPADPVLIDAVGAHLERTFGPGAGVIDDADSRWAHVDLFILPPNRERPVTVVATCGMAARPLTTTAGTRTWTELLCVLPPGWPTTTPAIGAPQRFWPLALLRWLARLPHQTGRGYSPGDTVGPLAHGTPRTHAFDAALLVAQSLVSPLPMVGREVQYLALCPLHLPELEWARAVGSQPLLTAFDSRNESPLVIWPERPSFAP
jgi:hypothetical protein